jgi:type IV pilus assembly protein PilO
VQLSSFQPGGQTAQQYFIENPYSINMSGSYHDVGRFLAAIALEQRIYNVRGVTYSAPDAKGKTTVNFTLVAYQYKG